MWTYDIVDKYLDGNLPKIGVVFNNGQKKFRLDFITYTLENLKAQIQNELNRLMDIDLLFSDLPLGKIDLTPVIKPLI